MGEHREHARHIRGLTVKDMAGTWEGIGNKDTGNM